MHTPSKLLEVAPNFHDENLEFRIFLKANADSDELDGYFQKFHEELFDGYDCCSCSNCCRAFNICFSDDDIKVAAKGLGMTEDRFISDYLKKDEDNEYILLPPCVFLEQNGRCSIQEYKPEDCKGFPFTAFPSRIECLYSVMDFASVCPIVFEIVERLKKVYRFKSKR